MSPRREIERLQSGVRNFDALLNGGIPKKSLVVIAGAPGSGKTILTQQICFHNATPRDRVLYFSTLSEPTAKTLRYLRQFTYFDAAKLDGAVRFVDLGGLLHTRGLEDTSRLVMEQVRDFKPAIVVIDSFRTFEDLTSSREDLRKFIYELAVQFMAWEASVFLLGEYAAEKIENNPLFSIIDGIIHMSQRTEAGEEQRFIQISKMRGTAHSRDEHSFNISDDGVEVYAPRVTIHRRHVGNADSRLETGIVKLDNLLGNGIPCGSSLLVAGVSGTGKTILLLEFLYRGALAGEKGILFSFEETEERLLATTRSFGWDFDGLMKKGLIEIVYIPQPTILVEADLLMMHERMEAMKARRVAVDSISIFLHKVRDPQLAREKVFQLGSIIQNRQAVGFFATDIPYGAPQVSRFGVEETVVDGVIVMTSTQEGMERHRFIEVYKLRNTAHLKGRHSMTIGADGMTIYPRYGVDPKVLESLIPSTKRLSVGVPGLDPLLGGGLLEKSVTLLSGSAGIGKSTMALQFIAEGVKRKEPGIFVSLEEGPGQILGSAKLLGLPLEDAVKRGLAEVVYLSRENALASQFLSRLVDMVRKLNAKRMVLDSLNHLVPDGLNEDELRHLLFALIARLKTLGVTTIFTLESRSLYSSEKLADTPFSSVADNLLSLRYARLPEGICPTLTIVKSRSSAHDFGTHHYRIDRGGVHLEERTGEPPETEAPPRPARRAVKRRT